MKCQCGQPMRQQIVAHDDIWWACIICGRSKPAGPVAYHTDPDQTPPAAAPVARKPAAAKLPPIVTAPATPVETHQPAPKWAAEIIDNKRQTKRRPHVSSETSKTLSDLNTSLFEQLDRLANAKGDALKIEIERTKAVSGLAHEIVDNAKLVLEAHRTIGGKANAPKMLEA